MKPNRGRKAAFVPLEPPSPLESTAIAIERDEVQVRSLNADDLEQLLRVGVGSDTTGGHNVQNDVPDRIVNKVQPSGAQGESAALVAPTDAVSQLGSRRDSFKPRGYSKS